MLQALRFVRKGGPLSPTVTSARGLFGSALMAKAVPDPESREPDMKSGTLTPVSELIQSKKSLGVSLHVYQNSTVLDAVRKMAEHNVGCILVLAQHQDQNWNSCASHIVGLISERDYLMKIALQGKRSDATTVDEIMTPASRIKTVSPQQNVIDAMMLMTEHNIRHLPVVTSEGEVKGLISIRDVVSSVLKDAKSDLESMAGYISGSY